VTRFEDHFSRSAAHYARYRPRYPEALFDWLASVAPGRDLAWDCGTGNGQAARSLARHFERVIATDASAEQIALAERHERIEYHVVRAEDVRLPPASVDLVTVAAAIHWFDHESFYHTVRRVLSPAGVLAVWTYHLPVIEPEIDRIIRDEYGRVVDPYWPERFRYVRERYRTLPFPFEEIEAPPFQIEASWDLEHLMGFMASWSSAQRYQADRGESPIAPVAPALSRAWGDPARERPIRWPIFLRAGREPIRA
jgi:SAM-dependent methyltransferase